MKICLDPGHYGSNYNPGVAAGYVESNFTWTYFFMMKERLERYGVEVTGTRASKDEDMGLQARGKCSEGCDLFISIHSNATGDNVHKPEMNAVFTHWSVRSGGDGIAKAIGNALTDLFIDEWGSCMDPIMYAQESEKHPGYDYFGVLKGAASVGTPGIIVEHSFHTNPTYCEWVMKPGNMEKMADVEVDTIAKYYGLEPTTYGIYYIPLNTNLKKGDKGEEVKKMQMRFRQIDATYDKEVREHSFTTEGAPDGSFGGKMVATVKRFQSECGLPETGELDFVTRTVLNTTVIEYQNRITELVQNNDEILKKWMTKAQTVEAENRNLKDRMNDAIGVLTI